MVEMQVQFQSSIQTCKVKTPRMLNFIAESLQALCLWRRLHTFIPALETPVIPLRLSCSSGAAEYGAISISGIAGLEFWSCAS
jgi:hypothetical protein